MWHVDTDAFPRSLYVLRDENGETLKTDKVPGWYRTSSRAKAERDCARLNRKEEKAMKAKERKFTDCGVCGRTHWDMPQADCRFFVTCDTCGDAYPETEIVRHEHGCRGEAASVQQAEPLTKVAFRFWYDGPGKRGLGEVTAIMPELPGTYDPYTCTCYAHIGQHGSCNLSLINRCSRPATEAEYAPLLRELRRVGYRVRVIQRVNQARYLDARRRELAKGGNV